MKVSRAMLAARRRPIDTGWTLAAVYLAFVAAIIPLQRAIWPVVAANTDSGLSETPAVLLGTWVVSFAAIAASPYFTPGASAALSCRLIDWVDAHARAVVVGTVAAAFAAALFVAIVVLQSFPNSGDEYAYVFQAERFAEGRLWAAAPPLDYTFVPYRTWISAGKWVSQYPPGWPLALALAILASMPIAMLNPVLGSVGAAALAGLAGRLATRAAVATGIALFVLTPFFLLSAGSFHSHVFSAMLVVALCLCCLRYQASLRWCWLPMVGLLLGVIGATRYFSLVLVAPALVYWLLVELRGDRVRTGIIIAASALPPLLLLLIYHDLVTGSPFRTTYTLIAVADLSISFAPENVRYGLKLTVYRFCELGVWASPVLVGAYVLCLVRKAVKRSLAFYDLVFPCFILGFVLFPDLGGNRYGPRYYFEAFPLTLGTILSAVSPLAAQARVWWDRPLAVHAALTGVLYLLTACPFALMAYHEQVEARQEPYRLARAMGLQDSIVVIKTTSGLGMLAKDLARNPPLLDAPVLYARGDVGSAALRRAFPHRTIWIYERHDPAAPGRLVPMAEYGEPAPVTPARR
jgi:hypothetical protein